MLKASDAARPAEMPGTLRAVFRLALLQTEGLIGSIIALRGLDLAIPNYSTLSRRAETLETLHPQIGVDADTE